MEINERLFGELLASGIREGLRRVPTVPWRTATVLTTDYINRRAQVVLDNDDYPTPCQVGSPDLSTGDRCWVVFVANGGAVALGPIGYSHPWRTFDPAVFGGSTQVGLNVVRAKYAIDQTTIDAEMEAVVTTPTGGFGAISWTLPVPCAYTGTLAFIGWASWYRAGTGLFHGRARVFQEDRIDSLRDPNDTAMGVAPAIVLSTGDRVQYLVRYERAV